MHVLIEADPLAQVRRQRVIGEFQIQEAVLRADLELLLEDRAFEARLRHEIHLAARDQDCALARALEIVDLVLLGAAVEAVVGAHPGIARRVVATIRTQHAQARIERLAAGIAQVQPQHLHGPAPDALARQDFAGIAAHGLQHLQAGVTRLVADEQHLTAVGRPARVATIEFPEGERQRRFAAWRGEPELMPLAALVARIQDPLALGRGFRSGRPRGLLGEHPGPLLRCVEARRPDVATAPGKTAVAHEVQRLPIRAPRRIYHMIEGRVVIAPQRLFLVLDEETFGREQPGLAALREIQGEAPVLARGHEHDALAVGRVARLHGRGVIAGQEALAAALQVEFDQLQRVVILSRENHMAPVGRHIGLVVVSRTRGELPRGVAVQLLQPQRAGHAVDNRLAVGREIRRRRPAGQLRHVELAPVVGMRQRDALQHRLTRRLHPHRH